MSDFARAGELSDVGNGRRIVGVRGTYAKLGRNRALSLRF